jgi:hypothetical protein
MTTTTYYDGVATTITPTRKIEVWCEPTAQSALEGNLGPARMSDMRALAAGYLALLDENERLAAELAAARAGQIGREHAKAMQGARSVIADLRQAGEAFFEVYDRGDAPDSITDGEFRARLASADHWLLCDSGAATARSKILKGNS